MADLDSSKKTVVLKKYSFGGWRHVPRYNQHDDSIRRKRWTEISSRACSIQLWNTVGSTSQKRVIHVVGLPLVVAYLYAVKTLANEWCRSQSLNSLSSLRPCALAVTDIRVNWKLGQCGYHNSVESDSCFLFRCYSFSPPFHVSCLNK